MFNNGSQSRTLSGYQTGGLADVRPLMRLVYLWMAFGLLTTGIVSYFVASTPSFVQAISGLFLPIIIGQFVLVLGLSWGINRMSPTVAGGAFFLYSVTMGLTMGVIFFAYVAMGQATAIANAFFTTAGLFGAMTVVGFTTKVDLSKYSTFFMMALIGLFIAMIVNMFLGSSLFDFAISVFGVLLFTGLTAYDTQRIKEMSMMPEFQEHNDAYAKMAIIGALTLYLDFINLFIFLLRLFSGGRD